MKFTPGDETRPHVVELTRRNLLALLAKLDDPRSQRTLVDGCGGVAVVAVEDADHYADRAPGQVYMPGTGETW